jgi:hypothetical protein
MIKNDQELKNLEEKLTRLSGMVLGAVTEGIPLCYEILYIAEITGEVIAEIEFYKEMRKKWYWFILKHFLP